MNIIWLGHGSFRIEIGDQVLLVDPWLNGNPMMEGQDKDAAIAGATHILVTHGHGDHTADVVEISGKTGAPVSGMVELAKHLHGLGAKEGHAFNKGGTITLGNVAVTLVPASHSSTMQVGDTPRYMGMETGFILRGDGKTLYFLGGYVDHGRHGLDRGLLQSRHRHPVGGRLLHDGHVGRGPCRETIFRLQSSDHVPLPHLPGRGAFGRRKSVE